MLAHLLQDVFQTCRDPRGFTRFAMVGWDKSNRSIGALAGLTIALYAIMAVGLVMLASGVDPAELPPEIDLDEMGFANAPLAAFNMALNMVVTLGLMSVGAWKVGQNMSGTGDLRSVTVAVVWHALCMIVSAPFIGLALAVILFVGSMIGFGFLGFVAILGYVFFYLWVEASLIGECHGFSQTRMVMLWVLGGHVAVTLVGSLILGILLALFGTG